MIRMLLFMLEKNKKNIYVGKINKDKSCHLSDTETKQHDSSSFFLLHHHFFVGMSRSLLLLYKPAVIFNLLNKLYIITF